MKIIFQIIFCLLLVSEVYAFKLASGSYVGDASNRTIDISDTTNPSVADFQPIAVLVKCDSATPLMWKTSTMGSSDSRSLQAGGSNSTTSITGIVSNGFTVGTNANANGSGVTCYYVAFGDDGSNDIAVGSYVGNSPSTQAISSIGFAPEFLILHGANRSAKWRHNNTGVTDETCEFFTNATCSGGFVTSMDADGFTVGTNANVNASGENFYYLLIKSVTGRTSAFNFTGDTNDPKTITTPNFKPEFFIIKNDNATSIGSCYRFKDNSGDSSFAYNVATATNQIESFETTGVTLGTADCSNHNTVKMIAYAIKGADIYKRKIPSLTY